MIKKPLPKDTNKRAKSIVELATGGFAEGEKVEEKKPKKKESPKKKP